MGTAFGHEPTALGYHSPLASAAKMTQSSGTSDQKIRHYKIEDRGQVRNIPSRDWPKSLEKRLRDGHGLSRFKVDKKQLAGVLFWLLDLDVEIMLTNRRTWCPIMQRMPASAAPHAEPLINSDVNNPDFKAGVMAWANLVQVQRHEDSRPAASRSRSAR